MRSLPSPRGGGSAVRPEWGGKRDGFRLRRAIQGRVNGVENAVQVPGEFGVPEPDDAVAFLFEPTGSGFVFGRNLTLRMMATVELDEKAGLEAGEVRDVGADGDLAAEVAPIDRNASQGAPENPLRLGGVRAELLCSFASEAAYVWHDRCLSRRHPTPALKRRTLPLKGRVKGQAAMPPPSVFSQAAPQALASSRTRRM